MAKNFPAVAGFSSRLSFVLVMSVELGASVCLLAGFCTRLAAFAGIGVMAVAYRVSKGPYFTSPALSFLLGFIAVFITDQGQYSLDALKKTNFGYGKRIVGIQENLSTGNIDFREEDYSTSILKIPKDCFILVI